MRKAGLVALIVAVLVAVVLLADHYSRCYGKPLSRDEALQRANEQLRYLSKDFLLGDTLPALADEQYDPQKKTWIVTFRNSTCEVSIITDRCHGTDVGGMSDGCKDRPRYH
jgi:hypothetical protein